jgi:hypothetical protein
VFWNCGSKSLTLRYSLLDIKITPYRIAAQPATVVRMQIQPRHLVTRRQHRSQLQLCVPQVGIDGPSYRMRAHQQRAEVIRKAATAGTAR